jgi:hypothetical protein
MSQTQCKQPATPYGDVLRALKAAGYDHDGHLQRSDFLRDGGESEGFKAAGSAVEVEVVTQYAYSTYDTKESTDWESSTMSERNDIESILILHRPDEHSYANHIATLHGNEGATLLVNLLEVTR